MFRNLFFAAVLAALCAGLVYSVVQQLRVTPLIIAAEAFEGDGGHSHGEEAAVAEHEHAEGTAEHTHEEAAPAAEEAEEWAPQDGTERMLYTVLANLLAAAGFALVIGAASVLLNIPLTFANGILWGLGGFITFQLAPAFGLAPELPGMPAADLGARQMWWVFAVVATGAGLLLVAKTRALWAYGAAAVLIVLPHLVGAPQLVGEHESAVPAHLATQFAAAALGAGAVFWVVLGLVFGKLNDTFAAKGNAV